MSAADEENNPQMGGEIELVEPQQPVEVSSEQLIRKGFHSNDNHEEEQVQEDKFDQIVEKVVEESQKSKNSI